MKHEDQVQMFALGKLKSHDISVKTAASQGHSVLTEWWHNLMQMLISVVSVSTYE